uniref:Uncharacterized protein n=1 Tax=Nelumbo nucifera TaxID=4432 RepID=A0A822YUD9_NELNU|nr:TPA_asm: hypothetical protein HUJ06_006807 [Nelumbo nucifera]
MVVATVIFFGKRKLARRRERKPHGTLVTVVNKSELNIKYEILEKATNYFSNSNKLGQGGSGSVYKVILNYPIFFTGNGFEHAFDLKVLSNRVFFQMGKLLL